MYYYYQNDERKGPFSQSALQAMIKQGIIPPGTKIEESNTGNISVVPQPKPAGANPFTALVPVAPVNRTIPQPQPRESFGATMNSVMQGTMRTFAAAIGFVLVIALAVFVVWMLYSVLVVSGTVPPPPAGSWLDRILMFGNPAVQEVQE